MDKIYDISIPSFQIHELLENLTDSEKVYIKDNIPKIKNLVNRSLVYNYFFKRWKYPKYIVGPKGMIRYRGYGRTIVIFGESHTPYKNDNYCNSNNTMRAPDFIERIVKYTSRPMDLFIEVQKPELLSKNTWTHLISLFASKEAQRDMDILVSKFLECMKMDKSQCLYNETGSKVHYANIRSQHSDIKSLGLNINYTMLSKFILERQNRKEVMKSINKEIKYVNEDLLQKVKSIILKQASKCSLEFREQMKGITEKIFNNVDKYYHIYLAKLKCVLRHIFILDKVSNNDISGNYVNNILQLCNELKMVSDMYILDATSKLMDLYVIYRIHKNLSIYDSIRNVIVYAGHNHLLEMDKILSHLGYTLVDQYVAGYNHLGTSYPRCIDITNLGDDIFS